MDENKLRRCCHTHAEKETRKPKTHSGDVVLSNVTHDRETQTTVRRMELATEDHMTVLRGLGGGVGGGGYREGAGRPRHAFDLT